MPARAPAGIAYPVYPTGGRCRHGLQRCPDFYCGLAAKADEQDGQNFPATTATSRTPPT